MYMNLTLGKKCHTGFPQSVGDVNKEASAPLQTRGADRSAVGGLALASGHTTKADTSLTPLFLSYHALCCLSSFSECTVVPGREASSLPALNIYSSTTAPQKLGAKLITT